MSKIKSILNREETAVDPVVLMAVERTTMAILSFSVSLIILGFVVEKFQLFIDIMGAEMTEKQRLSFPELLNANEYYYLGMGIVVGGIILAFYAGIYYGKWIRLLSNQKIDLDTKVYRNISWFIVLIGLAIVGLMLLS